MSEKEKKIVETITKAVSEMSDFDKGYLLGMGEAMVNGKKQGEKVKNQMAGNRPENTDKRG